jgi:hypothetical protein
MRVAILVLLSVLLPASSSLALELTPSQESFAPDEDIEILARNDTPTTVIFGSSAPYVARNLGTGDVVDFVGLAIVFDLPPGEEMTFGILGGALWPGAWSIDFRYWEGDYVRCEQSVVIHVATSQGTSAHELPVSAVKTRYLKN